MPDINSDEVFGKVLTVYNSSSNRKDLCSTCHNRYKIIGISQELYCSNCIHDTKERKDYYKKCC